MVARVEKTKKNLEKDEPSGERYLQLSHLLLILLQLLHYHHYHHAQEQGRDGKEKKRGERERVRDPAVYCGG